MSTDNNSANNKSLNNDSNSRNSNSNNSNNDNSTNNSNTPNENQLPIHIRELNIENDYGFVSKSYLKTCRNTKFPHEVVNTIFYAGQANLLNNYLVHRSTILVACDVNNSSNIYGYIIYERIQGIFVCHMVYVKLPFRNLGIAKALFKATGHDPFNFNHTGIASVKKHIIGQTQYKEESHNLIYNPYVLVYGNDYGAKVDYCKCKPAELIDKVDKSDYSKTRATVSKGSKE